MSERQALDYPLNRAFALKNFMIESNPHGRVVYESDGYIAQEIKHLKNERAEPAWRS